MSINDVRKKIKEEEARRKGGSSSSSKPASASSGSYTVGMRVSHKTFGEGLIVKTTPMGNDAMLEIAFDTVGTKKIMAGYARLTIL
jgi:DNA helicase-2/ATP-dependent DNA helicase PcrA